MWAQSCIGSLFKFLQIMSLGAKPREGPFAHATTAHTHTHDNAHFYMHVTRSNIIMDVVCML